MTIALPGCSRHKYSVQRDDHLHVVPHLLTLTRMHSSRMCTCRCSSRLLGRGEGVCPGGCLTDTPPSWTEFLTYACENITFPQLRLRTVINTAQKFRSLKVKVECNTTWLTKEFFAFSCIVCRYTLNDG